MKKILPFFLSLVVIIYQILPTFQIKAETMPTSSQYEQIGAFAFSQLLQSGEATELDFTDYTGSGTDFLIDIGEALFTGDFTGLISYGLNWLGDTADNAISSIQDSVHQIVHDMSPDLYNAWYGDVLNESYIELQDFDKSNHLGSGLRQLFTPTDAPLPTPQPDPDFSFLSNNIYLYYDWAEFIQGSANIYKNNGGYPNLALFTPSFNRSGVSYYDDSGAIGHTSGSHNGVYSRLCPLSNILSIYYDTTTQQARYVGANFRTELGVAGGSTYYGNSFVNFGYDWRNELGGLIWYFNGSSTESYSWRTDFSGVGISVPVNYFYNHFANFDLYVDNVLWCSHSSNTSYPIIIPDTLTIWDGQQLNYQFPDNTYIDLSSLTNIIRTAINNSDVVHWSDIESTYVDINGQQAVAVTRIYRNDDDNLYIEQYQNITLPKFSHNQISILGNYVNPVTQVVEESTDVLPTELVTLFKVAVILMLFACIVHRLLE